MHHNPQGRLPSCICTYRFLEGVAVVHPEAIRRATGKATTVLVEGYAEHLKALHHCCLTGYSTDMPSVPPQQQPKGICGLCSSAMPGLNAAALLLHRDACGTVDLRTCSVKTRFETVQA